MLHFHDGVFLTEIGLGLDVTRPLRTGYISHAHADHMAPHQLTVCTRETAEFYRFRLGQQRPVRSLRLDSPERFGSLEITLLPAGHMLGSSLIYVQGQQSSLLYTGDFDLAPKATAEPARLPQANILVMECTFGRPEYVFPPSGEVLDALANALQRSLAQGRVPIVHTYVLGKAQELVWQLQQRGFRLCVHQEIAKYCRLYQQLGVELGDYEIVGNSQPTGRVYLAPPKSQPGVRTIRIPRSVHLGVTGWAIDTKTKRRLQLDHVFPLSDHADFSQLVQAVQIVQPDKVYCVHGQPEFADVLRTMGWDAQYRGKRS